MTELAVLLFFVALACAYWWPLPAHLRTGQVEYPPIDNAFNQWIIGWGAHALTTDPFAFFDANAFHPHAQVLAWADHLFGLTVLAVPLVPLVGVVGATNVLLVGTTAASGWTLYLLVRRLVRQRTAAVVAGALFAVAWQRRIEFAHLQVQATQWIPVVFLAAEIVRDRLSPGGTGRRWPWILLLALAAWFAMVTNVYLAVFTVLAFAVYAASLLVLRKLPLGSLVAMAGAWALAVALALPLYLPSIRYQQEIGVKRSIGEQFSIGVNDLSPWPPPPGIGAVQLQERLGIALPLWLEPYVVDLVTALLLVVGAVLVLRRRRLPANWRSGAPYAGVAVYAIASALGPRLRWAGADLAANPVFLATYHAVPGYDALRVPARWTLLAAMALATVAAFPLAHLLGRRTRARRVLAGAAVLAVALAMLLPSPWHVTPSYDLDDYPAQRWLARQPGEFPILELPITPDVANLVTQEMETKRMLLSTSHWKRRVSGTSAAIHPRYGHDAQILGALPHDPEPALSLLRAWRVRYVIFTASEYAAFGADHTVVRANLDRVEGLDPVVDFGDQVVYRVTDVPRRNGEAALPTSPRG